VIEDCDGRRVSHLPSEHPECVHVAGLRDLDCRASSGFVRADYFWSAAPEESHSVSPRPQVRTRDHKGRAKARDERGTISEVNQYIFLRERESGHCSANPATILQGRDDHGRFLDCARVSTPVRSLGPGVENRGQGSRGRVSNGKRRTNFSLSASGCLWRYSLRPTPPPVSRTREKGWFGVGLIPRNRTTLG